MRLQVCVQRNKERLCSMFKVRFWALESIVSFWESHDTQLPTKTSTSPSSIHRGQLYYLIFLIPSSGVSNLFSPGATSAFEGLNVISRLYECRSSSLIHFLLYILSFVVRVRFMFYYTFMSKHLCQISSYIIPLSNASWSCLS